MTWGYYETPYLKKWPKLRELSTRCQGIAIQFCPGEGRRYGQAIDSVEVGEIEPMMARMAEASTQKIRSTPHCGRLSACEIGLWLTKHGYTHNWPVPTEAELAQIAISREAIKNTQDRLAKAVSLRAQRLTLKAIGEQLGVSGHRVRGMLHQAEQEKA